MSDEQIAATESTNESYIARTSGLKGVDYVGYAMGDVGCCLVFGLVTTLLQKFYTDIFLLNPLWIMIMMVAARLWDAINDPIMGRIADTIKVGNNGRYRRWLVWVSGPLALSAVLMFLKWPGMGETADHVGTFIYATITYIFFGMAYTAAQIPYGSLASVVTTDEVERNKLSTYRSVGAGLGSVPVMIIAAICYETRLDASGAEVIGENGKAIKDMIYGPVIIGVIIMALLSIAAFFFCYKHSKERVETKPAVKREKGETKIILKKLLTNKAFLTVSLASMLLLSAQMFTQSFNLYLFSDYFVKPVMSTVSVVCTYAPMAILMFFTPKLIRAFGKKGICAAGIALAAFSHLVMFLMKDIVKDAWWLYLVLCFFSGIGQTFIILQVWSLASDAIDDVEIKTGLREDGTAYASFMFFRKIGQMISAVAVNGALLATNYKTEKNAVQTLSTLNVMYDMATLIPAVMFTIMALILFLWCPLTKKRTAELQLEKEAILKAKFEKATESASE